MIKRVTDINSLSGVNSPLFPLIYADFKYSVSESDGVFIQEIDDKSTLVLSLKGNALTCIKLTDEYDTEELSSFILFWSVSHIISDFEIQNNDMKSCVLMDCKPETKSVSSVNILSPMSGLDDYKSVFSVLSMNDSSFDNWFPVFSRKINNRDAIGVFYVENKVSVSTAIVPYIHRDCAVLAGVSTNEKYRNRGFASHCVNAVINECKNKNINKLYLWCHADKKNFYENFGFTVCGEVYVKEEK